jgi:proteasome assembly chaperone 3
LQGRKTEIVQFSYDDYILVIVTQVGKLGTLLHARKEEGYGTAPTFNVSIIMGKRDEVVILDHPLVIVACPSLRTSLGVRTSAVYYCYRDDTFGAS